MSFPESLAWIGAALSALGLTDYARVKLVQPGTKMLATAIAERAARQWFGLRHSANQAKKISDLEREVAAQTATINRLLAAFERTSQINSMIASSSLSTDSATSKPPKRSARRGRSSQRRVKRAAKRTLR